MSVIAEPKANIGNVLCVKAALINLHRGPGVCKRRPWRLWHFHEKGASLLASELS